MFDHLPKNRRAVLKGLLAAGGAAFLAPFAYAAQKYLAFNGSPLTGATVKLSADDLTPDAPAKLLDIGGEPVIVVRESNNTIRAFTATCTHLGCTVDYRPQQKDFYCKCHRGRFDENGINVPGTKPKSPLTELILKQDAADLTVYLTPLKPGQAI